MAFGLTCCVISRPIASSLEYTWWSLSYMVVGPPCETKYTGVRGMIECSLRAVDVVRREAVLGILLNLGKATMSNFAAIMNAASKTSAAVTSCESALDIQFLMETSRKYFV